MRIPKLENGEIFIETRCAATHHKAADAQAHKRKMMKGNAVEPTGAKGFTRCAQTIYITLSLHELRAVQTALRRLPTPVHA
jgi:hypothetical protein